MGPRDLRDKKNNMNICNIYKIPKDPTNKVENPNLLKSFSEKCTLLILWYKQAVPQKVQPNVDTKYSLLLQSTVRFRLQVSSVLNQVGLQSDHVDDCFNFI